MLITIRGVEYDVEEYAHSHPGGVEVLHKYAGKDATKAFDAVGHSGDALLIMQRFRVSPGKTGSYDSPGTLADEKTRGGGSSRISDKLITREDRYHVHKVFLGTFCLLHYLVRLCLGQSSWGVYPALDAACLCAHAALSTSSLIFHVPQAMSSSRPGIWTDFRAHSIIFALRSIVYLLVMHVIPAEYMAAVSLGVVIAAMKCADVATAAFKDRASSTTLGMPYWPGCPAFVETCFKRFYALHQFAATLVILFSNPHTQFFVSLPIQGAAFLLTLVRKGLISTTSYHLCYSALLLIPWYATPRSLPTLMVMLLTMILMAYLRLVLGLNKYALWIGVFALKQLLMNVHAMPIHLRGLCAVGIALAMARAPPDGGERASKPTVQTITRIDQDVYRLRIQCKHVRNLKPGQHVVVTLGDMGRPYSPVHVSEEGLDIVVRKYAQGAFSPQLTSLTEGAALGVSAPLGRNWVQNGVVYLRGLPVLFKRACLIAGGTGIAPLMAVARALPPDVYRLVSIHRRAELLAADMQGVRRDVYIDTRPDLEALLKEREFDLVIVCGPPSLVSEVGRIRPSAVSW